jgi:hypothetical protein
MLVAMKPRLNFIKMGISRDSILRFARDPNITVTVAGNRSVNYKGEEMSLNEATKRILGVPQHAQWRPTPLWTYHGRSLLEIYEDTYEGN